MKLTNKLSFILGVRSLALLMCLGLLMALLQTFFDFKQRQQEVKDTIDSVVSFSIGSASNAAFLLSEEQAAEVVKGLSNFDYFSYIAIIDDRDDVMADFNRQTPSQNGKSEFFNPILFLFIENFTRSSFALMSENSNIANRQTYGEMVLIIDNHKALASVYERAMRMFVISLTGYIALTLALCILYHYTLASPLIRLARRFQRVNTKSIASQNISHVLGHEENEFSLIVNSANDMLQRISTSQILLSERSQRFRLILDTAPALIFSLDSNLAFVFANKSTATFYGYSIYELKGRPASEVIEPIDPRMMKAVTDFFTSSKRQLNQIVPVRNASSISCHMEMSIVKFKTPDGHSILVTATDVTKRVQAEEKIESLAYYDALTSLPNRNKVYEILNQVKEASSASYGIAAIADLDQFKRINDTLSHSVGDQLIVKLARRLRKDFSFSDLIARLGADEFLCIEENVSNDIDIAQKSAKMLGERLRTCISKDIEIGLHSYALSASVGVVVYNKDDMNADEILQYADTAMYESKRAGRNCVTLFQDEMATKAAQLLQLERDIMKAMFEDEFYFVLQPIVDSATQELSGAEALMRWRKGDELIQPNDFIPFLEESALIVEVGERILVKVCEYLSDLIKNDLLPDGFKVAVNISVKQLIRSDFIDMVSGILKKYSISGHLIEFEITESVALHNMVDTIDKILRLKQMDINFSLDDFGTGYSSLSYLKDLPVDKLKIDRSFINDITVDQQDENLVRSIIQLASNLGLKTVAEGVETQAQVEWLMVTGNILLQGYYFSKPLEVEAFNKQYLLSSKTTEQS